MCLIVRDLVDGCFRKMVDKIFEDIYVGPPGVFTIPHPVELLYIHYQTIQQCVTMLMCFGCPFLNCRIINPGPPPDLVQDGIKGAGLIFNVPTAMRAAEFYSWNFL